MSLPALRTQDLALSDAPLGALSQTRLLDHLLRGGDLSSGLDAVRAAAAADALKRERALAIGRSCPAVAQALGARFTPLVCAYVQRTPLVTRGDRSPNAREAAPEVGRGSAVSFAIASARNAREAAPEVERENAVSSAVASEIEDALRFARELAPELELGDAARAELLLLHARATPGRGFVGAMRLRHSRWLLVVVRLPLVGMRIAALPVRRSPRACHAQAQARNEPPAPVCGPPTAPDSSSSAIFASS